MSTLDRLIEIPMWEECDCKNCNHNRQLTRLGLTKEIRLECCKPKPQIFNQLRVLEKSAKDKTLDRFCADLRKMRRMRNG